MSTNQFEHSPMHQTQDLQPVTMGQLRWYMEGMRQARLAAVFGVLAVVSFGVVFGPLALARAKRAEALGVPATEGRVLGWVGIGLFVLWVAVMVFYVAVVFALVGNLPHSGRVGA